MFIKIGANERIGKIAIVKSDRFQINYGETKAFYLAKETISQGKLKKVIKVQYSEPAITRVLRALV